MESAIERAHSIAKSHSVALSRFCLLLETLQIFCRFKLEKLYNFVKTEQRIQRFDFHSLFMVLTFKYTF